MPGSQLETLVKTTLSFLRICKDWLLERVDVGKCFEGGLSTQQISNVFNRQEVLGSPLIAIEKYSGVRNGKIRAD